MTPWPIPPSTPPCGSGTFTSRSPIWSGRSTSIAASSGSRSSSDGGHRRRSSRPAHHHIGLNTWESLGGPPPPPGSTGLYHLAIHYPSRAALADALRRLIESGLPLNGAADHGVSKALYLRDPDQNGVELYHDRSPEEWPRAADGALEMYTQELDLQKLLAEAE